MSEKTEGASPADSDDLPAVLTVAEAAEFLRVHKQSVYAAIKARQIPARRIGNRVVILRDRLLGWLRVDAAGEE